MCCNSAVGREPMFSRQYWCSPWILSGADGPDRRLRFDRSDNCPLCRRFLCESQPRSGFKRPTSSPPTGRRGPHPKPIRPLHLPRILLADTVRGINHFLVRRLSFFFVEGGGSFVLIITCGKDLQAAEGSIMTTFSRKKNPLSRHLKTCLSWLYHNNIFGRRFKIKVNILTICLFICSRTNLYRFLCLIRIVLNTDDAIKYGAECVGFSQSILALAFNKKIVVSDLFPTTI